jgi:hypothetical protein
MLEAYLDTNKEMKNIKMMRIFIHGNACLVFKMGHFSLNLTWPTGISLKILGMELIQNHIYYIATIWVTWLGGIFPSYSVTYEFIWVFKQLDAKQIVLVSQLFDICYSRTKVINI